MQCAPSLRNRYIKLTLKSSKDYNSAAMLEILTRKLTSAFDKLGRKGKLSEGDIDEALREVNWALLHGNVTDIFVRNL